MSPDHLACLVLLLLAAGLTAWVVSYMRQPPFTPVEWVVYFLSFLLSQFLWRTTRNRMLPVAATQGAVVVANHRSSVDPFFIQRAVGARRVHWMVAREYVNLPAFGWFLKMGQVIPTNRGGVDTAATKQAIRYLRNGGLVGMLPEGRINMSSEFLLPVRPGAIWIALKAGVPVVPCYIEGAPFDKVAHSPLLMPARVKVVIGEPLEIAASCEKPEDPACVGQIMLQCMREIARLAGQDDCEPRLAGKRWKPTDTELQQAMRDSDRRRSSG